MVAKYSGTYQRKAEGGRTIAGGIQKTGRTVMLKLQILNNDTRRGRTGKVAAKLRRAGTYF